jgi:quinol monooxygenase YgiN
VNKGQSLNRFINSPSVKGVLREVDVGKNVMVAGDAQNDLPMFLGWGQVDEFRGLKLEVTAKPAIRVIMPDAEDEKLLVESNVKNKCHEVLEAVLNSRGETDDLRSVNSACPGISRSMEKQNGWSYIFTDLKSVAQAEIDPVMYGTDRPRALVCTGEVDIKDVDEFKEIMRAGVVGKRTREDGCTFMDFMASKNFPCVFVWAEGWKNSKAQDDHSNTEWFKGFEKFLPKMKRMIVHWGFAEADKFQDDEDELVVVEIILANHVIPDPACGPVKFCDLDSIKGKDCHRTFENVDDP